jgi:hypothetical protein
LRDHLGLKRKESRYATGPAALQTRERA